MTTGEASSTSNPYGDGKSAHSATARGGTDLILEAKPGPRHIYYRLYMTDGPLASMNPIYSNDHFISRVLSKAVAPPHNAGSLKKYLCRTEGLGAAEKCTLYLSLSEGAPVEDATRLSLQGKSGPGLSALDPMALVVDIRDKRSPAASRTPLEQFDETATRYVHYQFYEENGEVASKTSFDETDPCLGRINTLSVPPPYTIAHLKACLLKAEGVPGRNFKLFEDVGSETTMSDGDNITFLANSYPGLHETEPIAIVYTTQEGLGISEAPVSQPQTQEPVAVVKTKIENKTKISRRKPRVSLPHNAFPERGNVIEGVLIDVGDIFHTDQTLREEKPGDGGLVDEAGVDPKDIELIMQQVNCSRATAVRGLKESGGELLDAIIAAASY